MDCYEDKVLSLGIPPRAGLVCVIPVILNKLMNLFYVGLCYECAMKLVGHIRTLQCLYAAKSQGTTVRK